MAQAEPNNHPANSNVLFIASFLTLIAAGIGFAVRGGILADWSAQFGFTQAELGAITGGGLTGFGVTIIICSLFADRLGYKPILVAAFLLHALSAVVTLAATPVFLAFGKGATYQCLFWGMFLFALGNGLCEAVINPLVATLYPKQKTHYLNILHAGWPGGLILGGLIAFLFAGKSAAVMPLRWEINLGLFLLPVLAYGLMILKEKFPESEARAARVSFATMASQFLSPVLLLLLLLHALVGYVELGTDSWIMNIMNNVIVGKATLLFIYTSALMFVLRFFAGPIVERINPVGLLLASAVLGCIGLIWLGNSEAVWAVFLAGTVYGVGKTFLWPTMLGVVGERFPKGGALTMGAMGGIGMLSAGLLGGPGIGYKQDYYASQELRETSVATFERYKAKEEKSFLFFPAISGLDGAKVGIVTGESDIERDYQLLKEQGRLDENESVQELKAWWDGAKQYVQPRPTGEAAATAPPIKDDKYFVESARIQGGRMALIWTAAVPAAMAVGYLVLFLYFMSKGGYQAEVLHGAKPDGEHYTGGVEGPVR